MEEMKIKNNVLKYILRWINYLIGLKPMNLNLKK